ncbi:hypothetical protein EVAR_65765_1 [Eumeta japonica]|uniref:Mariner Mos1 transposase n=1 Tax=Eumeta variegata TaxID=151549 RepID=A0A4C1ZTB6_EUMVA|nr:hypothetical protein EVAR_65765_1 [Eumeta japonica]
MRREIPLIVADRRTSACQERVSAHITVHAFSQCSMVLARRAMHRATEVIDELCKNNRIILIILNHDNPSSHTDEETNKLLKEKVVELLSNPAYIHSSEDQRLNEHLRHQEASGYLHRNRISDEIPLIRYPISMLWRDREESGLPEFSLTEETQQRKLLFYD